MRPTEDDRMWIRVPLVTIRKNCCFLKFGLLDLKKLLRRGY